MARMFFGDFCTKIGAKQTNKNQITRIFPPKQAKSDSLQLSEGKIQFNSHELFKEIVKAIRVKNPRFLLAYTKN